jgi:hypothetical protein
MLKRDGGPKLSLAIKNKWLVGWMRSWFYCHIPCLRISEGGKSVHVLHSRMSALDYTVEPEVECSDDDTNDAAFVQATTIIGSQDTIEEFLACKMFALASGFGFKYVPVSTTPMSKIRTSLPLFLWRMLALFWWKWRLRSRGSWGASGRGSMTRLWRRSFQMGVVLIVFLSKWGWFMPPRPLPGSEASQAARDKRKSQSIKETSCKKGEDQHRSGRSIQNVVSSIPRHAASA